MTRYVWDPRKADENHRKHGVRFAAAEQALKDPMALSIPDPHPNADRWCTIGRPDPGLPSLLFVVHTEAVLLDSGPVARIISARGATRHERRRYEEG